MIASSSALGHTCIRAVANRGEPIGLRPAAMHGVVIGFCSTLQPEEDSLSDRHYYVEQTLAHLTPSGKIGQLLHPLITVDTAAQNERLQTCLGTQVGAVFQGGGRTAAQLREMFGHLDSKLSVPLLMSANYECGPAIAGMPGIGSTMAVAAVALTGIPEALGRAYPDRAIHRDDLLAAVEKVIPSPVIDQTTRS